MKEEQPDISVATPCLPSPTLSYANSPAGCSSVSPYSPQSSISSKRGRGRPRKTIITSFDPKKYEGLHGAEKKYKMLRDKNNEASRRSRLNRTQKVKLADVEVRRLERRQTKLVRKLSHFEGLQGKLKEFIAIMLSC